MAARRRSAGEGLRMARRVAGLRASTRAPSTASWCMPGCHRGAWTRRLWICAAFVVPMVMRKPSSVIHTFEAWGKEKVFCE